VFFDYFHEKETAQRPNSWLPGFSFGAGITRAFLPLIRVMIIMFDYIDKLLSEQENMK